MTKIIIAANPDIGFRGLGLPQLFLSLLYGPHDGGLTRSIFINPDPKVNFIWVHISLTLLHERDDAVRCAGRKRFKHDESGLPLLNSLPP